MNSYSIDRGILYKQKEHESRKDRRAIYESITR